MTGQISAKLRLVRCPKCRMVLAELPEIPVYKCGGCGTILEAKHRKTETRGAELCRDETIDNGKVEPDHIQEQKEISCLNKATIPSKGGSSADASTSRTDCNFRDCIIKQPGDKVFSDELPISSELSCPGNGDFSPELGEQMEQDKHDHNLDQDTGEGRHEFGDCCGEWHGARSFSDDFPSSMELTCHETEDSSPELQSRFSLDKDAYTIDHCTRMDKIEHGNCKAEQDKGSNFLNKVSSMIEGKHEENDLSPKFGAHGAEGKNVNLSLRDGTSVKCKFPENVDCCRGSSSFTETACEEHEKPSAMVEAKKKVDESSKVHMAESLKANDELAKSKTASIHAAENPLVASILLDNIVSPENQHLELSQNTISRGFERENSVDSFDQLPVDSSSSKLGVKHAAFSKSSMTRRYYAYDGSVSSWDGNEDQIPGRFPKPPRRKFKHSAFINSNELHRQDEASVKGLNKSEIRYRGILGCGAHDTLSSESKIRQLARKSLILEEKNHYAMKYKQHSQDDLPESRSYGHHGGRRIRVDKEEHASRLPFIPRYFPAGQRNGTPSSYHQHNVFQHCSGFCSPDIPSYTEPDKKELLRMVYDLKEELSRTHISKSKYSAGFTGEETHTSLCYNHLAPAEDICADLHCSRCPGRKATGLPRLHKISRMAFSGDAADYRHQVDCSCLRGYPYEWHSSAQLPSHVMCCNKVHRAAHGGHTCYKALYSASSSPQHYTSSRFSFSGHETISDDQRLRDTETKRLHVREKYYSAKRHLMPVAGGIPIVACYHCCELLQLPADFLLFGRRFHRLRCNACKKVMKFSLESRTHLAPNVADAIAPPPSMVDDCDDSIEQRDWASASHANKCPHAEPLSCSDDYGLSFDRSCSTEGEPSLMIAPLRLLESNIQNRRALSGTGSSFEPLEDRKMMSILGESRNLPKNSKENFGSEGPSTKMSKWGKSSSEIEEIQPTPGSPLHRLMGYSSPSEVIKP